MKSYHTDRVGYFRGRQIAYHWFSTEKSKEIIQEMGYIFVQEK
jgi:hypothetical protein